MIRNSWTDINAVDIIKNTSLNKRRPLQGNSTDIIVPNRLEYETKQATYFMERNYPIWFPLKMIFGEQLPLDCNNKLSKLLRLWSIDFSSFVSRKKEVIFPLAQKSRKTTPFCESNDFLILFEDFLIIRYLYTNPSNVKWI